MRYGAFYFLLFLAVAVVTFVFRDVLGKRQRRRAVTSIASWIIPAAVAMVAVTTLILFNLNFNGKII